MSQEPYLNEQVFNELFKKYFRPCCYCIYKFVKNLQVAEDIVKDSFAKMWVNRKRTDCEPKAKAFLYVSSLNAARNMGRHMQVVARERKGIIDYYSRDIEKGISCLKD